MEFGIVSALLSSTASIFALGFFYLHGPQEIGLYRMELALNQSKTYAFLGVQGVMQSVGWKIAAQLVIEEWKFDTSI